MKEVRELERQVGSVPGSEAASCGDDAGMGILVPYKRKDFCKDILLILQVTKDPVAGMEPFIVKAFLIDAVEAIHLDMAAFDFFPEGFDDLPVFIIVEPGGAGGEEKDRISGVTKNE